jgi:hypothetical protein
MLVCRSGGSYGPAECYTVYSDHTSASASWGLLLSEWWNALCWLDDSAHQVCYKLTNKIDVLPAITRLTSRCVATARLSDWVHAATDVTLQQVGLMEPASPCSKFPFYLLFQFWRHKFHKLYIHFFFLIFGGCIYCVHYYDLFWGCRQSQQR